MAEPTWYINKKETKIIINGEEWVPVSLHTSYTRAYASALYEIVDRHLYNAGAKQPTIDACVEEIQRLNALYNHITDTGKKDK